ncbi:MAG: hypothetical protein ABW019_13715 [Chitinophagaceae bacterium]
MFKLLLFCLLAWFLYNLVFRFIIPVYRTSRQVRNQFRQMNQHMQEQVRQQQGAARPAADAQPKPQKPAGDYIDFEEIK